MDDALVLRPAFHLMQTTGDEHDNGVRNSECGVRNDKNNLRPVFRIPRSAFRVPHSAFRIPLFGRERQRNEEVIA